MWICYESFSVLNIFVFVRIMSGKIAKIHSFLGKVYFPEFTELDLVASLFPTVLGTLPFHGSFGNFTFVLY